MTPTAVETITAVETDGVKTSLLRSAVGMQSDGRLVELVRSGSTTAYEAVVQRYRLPLVRYCSRIVGPDHAEDVVQDTFARAHASLMNDDRPMNLKPWLYRIAHNLSLNTLRGKAWNHEELDENFDGVRQPHEHLEQKDRLRDVVARVTALPERQRAALILQAVEGRSSEEIARELDGTVGDVRMLVHRARTRLRDAVGALIPLPLLLAWLKRGSSPATTATKPAGLTKAVTGSLVKSGAVALTGLVAAGGVVMAERGGPERHGTSKPTPTVSATLDRADGSGTVTSSHRERSARRAGLQGTSHRTSDSNGDAPAAPGSGDDGRDPNADNSTPRRDDHSGGDSDAPRSAAPDSSPTPTPQAGTPSQGGSTGSGGGSTGGGSTGGGSTGGGSGGGSTGGGSGGGSGGNGGLCVGPVAQLPPICLPPLGGGGSGGGGLLP